MTCAHRYRTHTLQGRDEDELVCGKCFLMKGEWFMTSFHPRAQQFAEFIFDTGTAAGGIVEISPSNTSLTKDFICKWNVCKCKCNFSFVILVVPIYSSLSSAVKKLSPLGMIFSSICPLIVLCKYFHHYRIKKLNLSTHLRTKIGGANNYCSTNLL